VGLSAQVAIPLPFTPVPLSLQTFAVLLVGAVLGSRRGAASMALYLLAGVAGVPWFVVAAWLVGRLAERGVDRHVLPSIGLMVLGNLAIYAFGVPGLMLATGMSLVSALTLGVLPFLVGDAVKIAVAAGLLPAAWKLVGSRR
jgi:biotin transport system substrate-specific component